MKSKGPTRRRWRRRWWRSSNSNSNSSNRRGKRLCRIYSYSYSSCSCLSNKKKKKKSNQWYQINVRGNKRWCPPSETKVQVLLLVLLLLLNDRCYSHSFSTNERKNKGIQRTVTCTISMYSFRWEFRRVSCHIQYTYNSSHKINLCYLQLKIKYL